MANNFPTSVNNYAGTETLSAAGHASAHNSYESKIGTGASTPIASRVLRGTGTGTSSWAQVVLTTDVTGTLPVANGGTGVAASTGTVAVVLSTSPTLITPILGVATATSINKVALTAPATAATITIINNKTFTVNKSLTLDGTDTTTMTFPASSDTVMGLAAVQTLTGKKTFAQTVQTITAYSPAGGGTATLDLSLGNIFTVNVPAGNITIALSNATTGQCFMIRFVNDTSARTITYFTTIKWDGGAAPTLSGTTGRVDTFGFVTTGSNTYDGHIVGQNAS